MAPSRGDFLRETARLLAANGRRQAAEMYARRAAEVEPGIESSLVVAEITGSEPEPPETPAPERKTKTGIFSRFRRKKKS